MTLEPPTHSSARRSLATLVESKRVIVCVGSGGVGIRDDDDLARGVVQPASAFSGHRDDVLDPHPEAAGEIDAGFDREAHPGHHRPFLALDHVRRLVRGHADPMTGAVDELRPVPGVDDHPPGGPVPLVG